MSIKNVTVNRDFSVTLVDDIGNIHSMLPNLAECLKEQYLLMELRTAITNKLDDEIDGGYIDLSKHEYTREDFEEEVFSYFEDDISQGIYYCLSDDGDSIREKISDLADYYGLNPTDDDDDDDDDGEEY